MAREVTGPRIGLWDMDGSLADYAFAMRRDLLTISSPHEHEIPEGVDPHELEDLPYMKARMDMVRSQPCWWENLPRIEMGFELLKIAQQIGFEDHILTKGPKSNEQAWAEKLKWCKKQPELDDTGVCVTMNKGITYGYFLYDDFPKYMDTWLANRPRGLGIMPVTPYNRGYTHPRCVRWNGKNVDEMYSILQACFQRNPGEALDVGSLAA